ncbi:hypothetical protein RFI_10174, partial [Reticulomyxa filosa]
LQEIYKNENIVRIQLFQRRNSDANSNGSISQIQLFESKTNIVSDRVSPAKKDSVDESTSSKNTSNGGKRKKQQYIGVMKSERQEWIRMLTLLQEQLRIVQSQNYRLHRNCKEFAYNKKVGQAQLTHPFKVLNMHELNEKITQVICGRCCDLHQQMAQKIAEIEQIGFGQRRIPKSRNNCPVIVTIMQVVVMCLPFSSEEEGSDWIVILRQFASVDR